MKLRAIALLSAFLTLFAAIDAFAAFTCAEINSTLISPVDQVRVRTFRGLPGDTVLMPVEVRNSEAMSGFRILIKFDTNFLRPVGTFDAIDPTIFDVEWVAKQRFVLDSLADDGSGGFVRDTVTPFFPQLLNYDSLKFPNVVTCFFYPDQDLYSKLDTFWTVPATTNTADTLFFLKFEVVAPASTPANTQSPIQFFERNMYTYFNGPLGNPDSLLVECLHTQLSLEVTGGSNTAYPITNTSGGTNVAMNFIIGAPGPTITFDATPTSLPSGGGNVTLTWSSANATSVQIRSGASTTNLNTSGALAGSVVRNISSTTVFTAVAYNGTTDSVKTTKTVTVGTIILGDPPTINTNPLSYTINEGEPLSFLVTSSDPNSGDQITVQASNVPSGASFGNASFQVFSIAPTPATGTFSWTPNFGQAGAYQVTFTARDQNNNSASVSVNITVEELEFDRLFSTSVGGQRPVGGRPGRNNVIFPIDLVSAQPNVYGIQFDLLYPQSVVRIDSFIPTGRIPEYVIWDNIGVTPGNIRIIAFGPNYEKVGRTTPDTTTAILYTAITIDSNAAPWTSAIMRLVNGWESVSPSADTASLPLITDSGVVEIDSVGDVNHDKRIDVADVVNIVGYIIGPYTFNARQFDLADIIADLSIDVFDLVADINMVFPTGLSPAPGTPTGEEATVQLAYAPLASGSSDFLKVESEISTEVAGVQLEISYDPNAVSFGTPTRTSDNLAMALQYRNEPGKLKILLYSLSPTDYDKVMHAGIGSLIKIPMTAKTGLTVGNKNQIRLTKALLSTSYAGALTVNGVDAELPSSFELMQNYPNPFNPTTTIEFSIGTDDVIGNNAVRLEIYNVLGQRVRTLVDGTMSAGQHSVEWDATTDTGTRVASGVYLYRMQVGERSQTRKMLFLK